jgi:hypothetical protein
MLKSLVVGMEVSLVYDPSSSSRMFLLASSLSWSASLLFRAIVLCTKKG